MLFFVRLVLVFLLGLTIISVVSALGTVLFWVTIITVFLFIIYHGIITQDPNA